LRALRRPCPKRDRGGYLEEWADLRGSLKIPPLLEVYDGRDDAEIYRRYLADSACARSSWRTWNAIPTPRAQRFTDA
jgi:hypothetical protein